MPVNENFIEKLKTDGNYDMAEKLSKYYRNAVILCDKNVCKTEIPIGSSKIGGYPDLPNGVEYPVLSEYKIAWKFGQQKGKVEHYKQSAMQLVAQINLYELASTKSDTENLLPKTGMLYFFWSGEILDLKDCNWYDIEILSQDKAACHKVIWWDGDTRHLKRTKPDIPYYSKYFTEPFKENRIEFCSCDEYSEESADYIDGLEEVLDIERYDFSDFRSKLLGIPHGVNGPHMGEDQINLFQYSYHEGCLDSIFWIIDKKDLLNYNFENALIDYDLD